jgi:hypothetical protein
MLRYKTCDTTEENVYKNDCASRANPIPAGNAVHMATDQVNNIQPVGDND